jgi:ribosomal protein S18 acetylase RimI-like enzyme
MAAWTVERGTLWVVAISRGLPPPCPARLAATFSEAGPAGLEEVAAAMKPAPAETAGQRLASGRRCFVARVDGAIAAYGWVTQGPEWVGELERAFNIDGDEAYLWDFATGPAWQGQRLYSALLGYILGRLEGEGTRRVWIGASRQNEPSVRGFANAGFQPVMDVVYRRWLWLTTMRFAETAAAGPELINAAYRILVRQGEWRMGRLAAGLLRF